MSELAKHDFYSGDNGVCAVVVTYNIGKRVLQGLEALLNQVEHIVVVDNNSSDNSLRLVQDFAKLHSKKIQVIFNKTNNLAAAQNIGIKQARILKAKFVLIMDHDSVADYDMVFKQLQAYALYDDGKLAIVAPNLCDKFSKRKSHYIAHYKKLMFSRVAFGKAEVLTDIMLVIASGSLIPMHVIDEIGLMNEDFCIDQVDFEWCLRAVSRGYKIIALRDAHLLHQLGKCRDFKMLKVCVTTSNHNAVRRYYIYRNRLRLWGMYGLKVPAFVMFDMVAIAYDLVKITMFEASKKAKIKAALSGARDTLFRAKFQTKPNNKLEELSENIILPIKHVV
jgi:rhamnosyltransferase